LIRRNDWNEYVIRAEGRHVQLWPNGLPWIDALLNASMILAGMGPVDPVQSTAAKLFATFYALYSGIAFLTMIAILMAPLLHRFLHKFHLEMKDER
jgi:hypothetical protein